MRTNFDRLVREARNQTTSAPAQSPLRGKGTEEAPDPEGRESRAKTERASDLKKRP